MVLTCDSGSTKASWIISGKEIVTDGINALQTPPDRIEEILFRQLVPQLGGLVPDHIYFYGAGCVGVSEKAMIARMLENVFPGSTVEVDTDLVGAAKALCGDAPGIACILGTGSNSCLYDGKRIVENVPPLGYILGDEGSGAVLGKRFVANLLKGLLPKELRDEFYARYSLDYPTVIRRIYREPGANAFLASFCPFIHEHCDNPQVNALVSDSFSSFFERNLMQYPGARELPVGFVGSIACFFEGQLRETARKFGVTIGRILRSPSRAIYDFHSERF